MSMFCVTWCHYNGQCFTQGHEWAVAWTAGIDKSERLEGSCQWCGSARLMHKSPVAAFNLRKPWLICCASPSTQSPNKSCSLELRRMASQRSHSSKDKVRQLRRSEKQTVQKQKQLQPHCISWMSGPREHCWKIRHPQSQQGPQKLKPKQCSMKWLIFAVKTPFSYFWKRSQTHCNSRDTEPLGSLFSPFSALT